MAHSGAQERFKAKITELQVALHTSEVGDMGPVVDMGRLELGSESC